MAFNFGFLTDPFKRVGSQVANFVSEPITRTVAPQIKRAASNINPSNLLGSAAPPSQQPQTFPQSSVPPTPQGPQSTQFPQSTVPINQGPQTNAFDPQGNPLFGGQGGVPTGGTPGGSIPIRSGTGGDAPPIVTAQTQLAGAQSGRANFQQNQAQQQAFQSQLESAQSQLQQAQNKLSTINQATTAGFGGNNYAGAVNFLTGQEDDDERTIGDEGDNVANLEAQVQAALQAMVGAQGPSQQQTDVEGQLGNILQSRDLGIEAVRSKPIATPFIRGQAAGIQRQAEISTRPLLSQISDFQKRRETQQRVAQIRYQASTEALSRGDQQERDRKDRQETLRQEKNAIAQDAASNGATSEDLRKIGQAKTTREALQIAAPFLQDQGDGGFTLGTGQQRFDSQGNLIAAGRESAPVTPKQVPFSQWAAKAGVLGMTQEQATDLYNLPNPPPWFRQKMEQQTRSSLRQEALQQMWDEAKRRVQESSQGGESSTGGFNFEDF